MLIEKSTIAVRICTARNEIHVPARVTTRSLGLASYTPLSMKSALSMWSDWLSVREMYHSYSSMRASRGSDRPLKVQVTEFDVISPI